MIEKNKLAEIMAEIYFNVGIKYWIKSGMLEKESDYSDLLTNIEGRKAFGVTGNPKN
jgi:hypothetical protein